MENSNSSTQTDVILVGGGLANGLIALRLQMTRPETRVLIVESEKTLGGEHTWSFHTSDLTPDQLTWIRPLITRSWPSYRAMFPQFERTLSGGYHSVASTDFHRVLSKILGNAVWLNKKVTTLSTHHVMLSDGSRINGQCVIDGRGFPANAHPFAGYQKFLGIDVTLSEPHGEADPILMDGRVPQVDGLRFFYTLPWSERTIQIGEARFSDSPEVIRKPFREAIEEYARRRGWKIKSVQREEVGILPAPMGGDVSDFNPGPDSSTSKGIPTSGVRAGLFHTTTGYSLPFALRFAEAVSALPILDSPNVFALGQQASREEWERAKYFRLLNRMLFKAAAPDQRFKMFQQFYRRSEKLIQRFYYGRLKPTDYVRIMTGKPPISLVRAMNVFLGKV